jgi:hypothetical protein
MFFSFDFFIMNKFSFVFLSSLFGLFMQACSHDQVKLTMQSSEHIDSLFSEKEVSEVVHMLEAKLSSFPNPCPEDTKYNNLLELWRSEYKHIEGGDIGYEFRKSFSMLAHVHLFLSVVTKFFPNDQLSILDVGGNCGLYFMPLLLDFPTAQLKIVDLQDINQHKFLRVSHCLELGNRISFCKANIFEYAQVTKEKFTVIGFMNLLHFLDNQELNTLGALFRNNTTDLHAMVSTTQYLTKAFNTGILSDCCVGNNFLIFRNFPEITSGKKISYQILDSHTDIGLLKRYKSGKALIDSYNQKSGQYKIAEETIQKFQNEINKAFLSGLFTS